jgi:hypothetical protein
VKEPATEPVHESVDDPELAVVVKTILVEDIVQVRPVVGETDEERATVPVKPLTPVTVIVELPAEPTATITLVGLAVMVKSEATFTTKVTSTEWVRDPLEPVTPTAKVPAVDPVHDRVDVAEVMVVLRATLVGLRAHVRPVDGEIVSANAIVPVKPFNAETVMVDVPVPPEATFTVVGLGAIVKSWKVKVAIAEWVIDPLVPVNASVNEAAVVELQDTVAVPEPTMLLGVIMPQVRPAGTVSVKLTVPVKPFRAVTVIVDIADEPALTAAGLVAAIEKSAARLNVKVAVEVWVSDPLMPVIVTLSVAALAEEHEKVAVPEPVMLLGVIAPQVNPAGTVSVNDTTPAKPFWAVTVIVDVIEAPTVPEGEVAARVKLTTVNVEVAVWVIAPLVPVIVKA